MKQKKPVLIALVVILAILAGFFAFRLLNAPKPGDGDADASGSETHTVPEPVGYGPINEGKYQNGKVLAWKAPRGGTFSVGLKSGGDNNYIYLNITYSKAKKNGNSIGYYLKSDRGLLEFSGWDEYLTDCDSGENVNQANFYIPGQLYDQVAAMEFTDTQHYGVRWADDGSDGAVKGATITARAVNLNTAEFLGVFDIVIGYNEKSGTYEIESVQSADVSETGELSEEERKEAVESAITFAADTVLPEELYDVWRWQDAARAAAVVHKSERTYFARLLNTEKKSDKFVNHSTCQDTFAVTLPISLYGYLTVYLAPKTECIGLTEPTMFDSDDMDLTVYGYDPLNPRNSDTIVTPIDFFSY